MSYISKNKSVWCGENEELDLLLTAIENTAVLSEKFSGKIIDIGLVIVTNLETNEDYVFNNIAKLHTEMKWMNIFSSEFIHMVNSQLLLAVQSQQKINSKWQQQQ
jgi:hypothetical protein